MLKRESFIKVQINFLEQMCFGIQSGELRSLIDFRDEELSLLYDEYTEYTRDIKLRLYDIREILSEKIRAILTRRGIKARDFVDVYLINKNYSLNKEEVRECTLRKIGFSLRHYERFRKNFLEKIELFKSESYFDWGGERSFLISEIDEKDFYEFLKDFKSVLELVIYEIK